MDAPWQFPQFELPSTESRFMRDYRWQRLWRVEVAGAALSAFATSAALIPSMSLAADVRALVVASLVRFAGVAVVCGLSMLRKSTWDRVHDASLAVVRLLLGPAVFYIAGVTGGPVLRNGSPIALLASLFVGLGGAATFIDPLLYPLKLKHHAMVHVLVVMQWGVHNWRYCEACCRTPWEEEMMRAVCSALGQITAGIEVTGPSSSSPSSLSTPSSPSPDRTKDYCKALGFQIPTLGLVVSTIIVYLFEQSSRRAFLQRETQLRAAAARRD